VSYGNGEIEARKGSGSLEAIERAQVDGTALCGYLRSTVSNIGVEAYPYRGDVMGTGH